VANEDHLAKLREGVEIWNEWRTLNPVIQPDLSSADLSEANLCGANLSSSNLKQANLDDAHLRGADLSLSNLSYTSINNADLSGANLREADLSVTNSFKANLSKANLSGVNLRVSRLDGVNLSEAILTNANLSGSNLCGANLRDALLMRVQALDTKFISATFTGSCLEDWNINRNTWLENVKCDYVFLSGWDNKQKKWIPRDRRPSDPNATFAPGEFVKLVQKALNTVDLIFADGIDWKAFFQSFQELRSQYNDDNLSIQAIEKKSGGAFVIRLEVSAAADKAGIESQAKELYERDRQLLEAQYRERLNAKDDQIEIYKQQSSSMEEIAKLLAVRPIQLEEPKVTLKPEQVAILQAIQDGNHDSDSVAVASNLSMEIVRYYLKAMQKDGYVRYLSSLGEADECQLTDQGIVALTNPGLLLSSRGESSLNQTFNNYLSGANIANFANQVRDSASQNASEFSQAIGQNADDITRILVALREQAQQFPEDQRDAAQMGLDDLQQDLNTPEKLEPKRLRQRLISLLMVLRVLGSTVATAADFANNALELGNKFGISKSELLQYIPTHLLPPFS
jgi:uncharacterized protein YjbI with pentapeptide repeats/predicted transcriptional regulator